MWERASAFVLYANGSLQVLDATTTRLALQAGGIEANPLGRALMAVDAWLWVKAALVLLLVGMALRIHHATNRERAAITVGGAVAAVLMASVVVHNASIAVA